MLRKLRRGRYPAATQHSTPGPFPPHLRRWRYGDQIRPHRIGYMFECSACISVNAHADDASDENITRKPGSSPARNLRLHIHCLILEAGF